MPNRTVHGREPEPLEELLDCLAYVRAVQAGEEETALAAFDVVRSRLAGRRDAMVAPLTLAGLILVEAVRHGCEAGALLDAVRSQARAALSAGARPGAAAGGGLAGAAATGDLAGDEPG